MSFKEMDNSQATKFQEINTSNSSHPKLSSQKLKEEDLIEVSLSQEELEVLNLRNVHEELSNSH
jgi:hypothetical protein